MYASLLVPWSHDPSPAESRYQSAGLLNTKGTLHLLPPSTQVLVEAFNALPRPESRMSAGAVALCKHFERSGGSSEHGRPHPFWTLPVGSNENKNVIAEAVLSDMLATTVWRNVMLLHPGVAIYEVRNKKGFGMRWTLVLDEVPQQEEGGQQQQGEGQDRSGSRSPCHAETGEKSEDDKGLCTHTADNYRITKTTFRGFIEPIEGMDHEL